MLTQYEQALIDVMRFRLLNSRIRRPDVCLRFLAACRGRYSDVSVRHNKHDYMSDVFSMMPNIVRILIKHILHRLISNTNILLGCNIYIAKAYCEYIRTDTERRHSRNSKSVEFGK